MRMSKASRRIGRFGRRLARDESGAALIYVSIALTVFMGFAALVIDGSRLFAVDTEMQSAADAIALAGAAELDGNADAQDRADAAMANLVQNDQTFGTGAAAITGFSRRFLEELPDDDQPVTDDFLAADAPSTRFVEVTIDERQVGSMFATAIGGENSAGPRPPRLPASRRLSASSRPCSCAIRSRAPTNSLSYFTDQFDNPAEERQIIALKKVGQRRGLHARQFRVPGIRAWTGGQVVGKSLASVEPAACFRQDGVETKTGSTNSVHKAINMRFDLYANGLPGSWKSSSEFRPAKNVTKGISEPGGGGGGGGGSGGGGNGGGNGGNGGGGGGGGNPCNVALIPARR